MEERVVIGVIFWRFGCAVALEDKDSPDEEPSPLGSLDSSLSESPKRDMGRDGFAECFRFFVPLSAIDGLAEGCRDNASWRVVVT